MKSTIALRKKHIGWITNDSRKRLVSEGKLRPGNTTGEKCLCCRHISPRQDRCLQHDVPTSINAYCMGFSLKS